MEYVIGIDLGTSNSAVSIVDNRAIRVLPNERGETVHASVVAFLDDGRILVGNEAKRQMLINRNTVYSAKRLIGRKYFSSEVKKAKVICPYEIVEGPNSEVLIRVNDVDYTLPEISAFVLREMKRIAELNLGQEVTKAVVTVPAYFNDGQRQATNDAAIIAGLDVLRIINEPTAAALAYGYGKGLQKNIVIYDLGGGTFDVSILNLGENVYEVTGTAGDTYLGGDDFDDRIVDYAAEEFLKREGVDLRNDNMTLQKLKNSAEMVKIQLSATPEARLYIEEVVPGKTLDIRVTENLFRELTFDLIQKTFKVCDEALQSANMTIDDIDDVILVGGPTKMHIIRDAVGKYFFKEPLKEVDPDTVVAQGAAIQANLLLNRDDSALLLDVTPLSLGVGIAGGYVERLIERNTPIPTSYTHTFTTTKDGQTAVKIKIYQGESRKSAENEILGEFTLEGIREAKRGEARIDVTFSIDTNGIVHAMARDQETGEEKSISINVAGGLSQERLEELKRKQAGQQTTAGAPGGDEPSALAAD